MGDQYEVRPGDCITSLAFERGMLPDTIWEAPENRELRELRGDPGVLLPGDVVFIPDKRARQESRATGAKHRFRRKGIPVVVRLEFLEGDEPMADLPYVLTVDGRHLEGRTDGDGILEQRIPPNAKRATLLLGEAGDQREFEVELGHLDPVCEGSGQRARLNHLGFDCGWDDSADDERRSEALAFFRQTHRSGNGADDADEQQTVAELEREHGA